MGRIVPIYEAIGGISSRMLRRIIYGVLQDFDGNMSDPLPAEISRTLPFSHAARGAALRPFPAEK